jgi:hypothetical protein
MPCPWCQKFVNVALLGAFPTDDPELPGQYNQRLFGVSGQVVHMPEGFLRPRICSCGTVYCPLEEAAGKERSEEKR